MGAGVYLYSDITDISLYHRENVAEIRIFGIGGLGGYIGKFYNSKIGFYTAYVGDYSQAFLIKINNREKYVMSCRHAEKIVEEVKSRLKQ
ncbi:PH domain-containing protein [Phocaeicola vulgatus]|uniref:PH domain-containing protein n=1 Tax=Phocaeicola vulgatus TaxID=821 RepID=UPI0021655377|nr:PH domain-containing protein [Phocaeicola vulgatus]MCS2726154.1 PH domain-containing protein [Phocaeicola vulgatus]